MSLVKYCKDTLQDMRDNGFEALLDQVFSFCGKHDIEVPNMDDEYVAYEWQLAELNHRFSEVNTELLLCLAFATTSVERAFSAMNVVKGPLRNRMGDQWLKY
ncbi:PREDICTED: uncharacterized protein LOC107881094 [Prunus mume]|uniref:Uncharacterized protein LOC107881094 n=1 Tax=Prunus mume TaxID=102107 RepID=A0ABM1LQH7_PRUMU|nr:PREDICTED: uncharacterized protein LOC107881094 [Prunus mume]